jgi:hypothetical protein
MNPRRDILPIGTNFGMQVSMAIGRSISGRITVRGVDVDGSHWFDACGQDE